MAMNDDAGDNKYKPWPLFDKKMPIITLWQPWAQWVYLGWKTIETRTHDKFRGLEGKRIGIHAGSRWDDNAIHEALYWLSEDYIVETANRQGIFAPSTGGNVICSAIVGSHTVLTPMYEREALIESRSTRRFGLKLLDVKQLNPFIPAKGKQGIWYL